MAIESDLVPFDHEVVIIYSHRAMIMRDRKDEDFPIQLFLALHRSKKFDKSSDDDDHAVRVLTIDNIESDSAALHLADEEEEVHPIDRD